MQTFHELSLESSFRGEFQILKTPSYLIMVQNLLQKDFPRSTRSLQISREINWDSFLLME